MRQQVNDELGLGALAWMLPASIKAVRLCMSNGVWVHGLMLLYATIDQLGVLSQTDPEGRGGRGAFIAWVDEFMLPESGLPCTAVELYAARCGLLHAHSPGSNLSREGKAREILYAQGKGTEEELAAMIELVYEGRVDAPAWPVPLHVDRLVEAWHAGALRFGVRLQKDAAFRERVLSGAARMFSYLPMEEAVGFVDRSHSAGEVGECSSEDGLGQ